jgi:putative acetyltransferase
MDIGLTDVAITLELPRQPEVARLIVELDTYLMALYPDESNHLLDVETLAAPDVRFFVARRGADAVGCGALRIDAAGYGEVKRMFVLPAARGLKLGVQILRSIEDEARRLGLGCLRLETGIYQPEAIGLYRAAGFVDRPPFGGYRADPLSLFMEKTL